MKLRGATMRSRLFCLALSVSTVSIIIVLIILQSSFSRGENFGKIVYPGENGKLIYAADENGNTVLDFSHCGYMGGGVKLPEVEVKVILAPGDGDDGARIQAAINEVAKLPL